MERQPYNFENFKEKIRRGVKTPISESSYTRSYGKITNPVRRGFSLQKIIETIQTGSLEDIRELSRYYYRVSGIYRGVVNLITNFSLYQTVVTPMFDVNKSINKESLTKNFYKACRFVEDINVPVTFAHITHELLLCGIYYGLMRSEGDKYVIQDLPPAYCRTRFKDLNGLNIVEFNVNYFQTITDKELQAEALSTFPTRIIRAFRSKKNKDNEALWVEIYPEEGGVCFFQGDKTPLFIASIPQIYKMDEAIDRENERDENELYKLLIQRMPIDSKGELVFQLDEVADIHSSTADMLADIDTVDVLTTFGETSLENIQDSTSATQSANRIEKYKTNTYDNLGVSSLYFNPDTSGAMPYMIAKDEALVANLTNQYSTWMKLQINHFFAKSNFYFDFTILPTNRYNRKDIQSQMFQGAQYGYSKIYAGVAIGIPQVNMISLMEFENNYLQMSDKMLPLMSSYTSSSKDLENKKAGSEEKVTTTGQTQDISNEGGRPTLPMEQRDEATVTKIDSQ